MNNYKKLWTDYAKALGHPISANGLLSSFVTNPDVTGAYAESCLRSIIADTLPNFRISTGCVIRSSDLEGDRRKIPQCDIIIWDPSDMPAIFEHGNFALVSSFAARAVIEIKRKTVKPVDAIRKDMKKLRKRLQPPYNYNVLGVLVDHESNPFPYEVNPDWLKKIDKTEDPPVTSILCKGQIDTNGIFAFIYFLSQIAGYRYVVTTRDSGERKNNSTD